MKAIQAPGEASRPPGRSKTLENMEIIETLLAFLGAWFTDPNESGSTSDPTSATTVQ
jgi:hypothetical protein